MRLDKGIKIFFLIPMDLVQKNENQNKELHTNKTVLQLRCRYNNDKCFSTSVKDKN